MIHIQFLEKVVLKLLNMSKAFTHVDDSLLYLKQSCKD